MTAQPWQRVKDLFHEASRYEADARSAFLQAACEGDRELRREVETLLRARDEAGAFLSNPVGAPAEATAAADAVPEGRQIGPYRIQGLIAQGGMGAVYRAGRDDDAFRKTVALKLVRSRGGSPDAERRFRQEREILARLQHPHIATILDGGASDDGQPYLVMEYVEGQPITIYCDERGLATRQRLAMFATVCAAVHYAHQNLVIHRDLKPANILVTADGTPKLLDFGIAKLLAADLALEAAPTATLLPLMTPEYASPEQVRGGAVTTASDVYSLGVLLYELLTGRRPYELRSASLEDIVRSVCETDPQPPSSAARTRRAGGLPQPGRPAASELRGDLDTIVLKALRKEPSRRYLSALELADDVRRHLEGRPVRARPDTLRYRAAKFVGRNRVAVAAAALVVVALLGGLFASARQARIAERERALAQKRLHDLRRLSNSLLFEMHDSIARLAGATEARRLLVQRATEYLDLLAAEAPGNAEVARDLAEAHERLADVLGGTGAANLGDPDAALKHYRQGLAIRERLVAERPDDLDRQRGLAASLRKNARAEPDGAAATGLAGRAVEMATRSAAADPGRLDLQSELAASHYAAGMAQAAVGDWTAAVASYRAAGDGYRRVLDASPGDEDAMRYSALCEKRLGAIMNRSERWAEAAEHYRRALDADESRAARAPKNAPARRDVSVTCVDLSITLNNLGDPAGAAALLRRALGIREELARADPSNVLAQIDLVSVQWRLASSRVKQGDWRTALRELGPATAAAEALSGPNRQHLADVLYTRANAYQAAGQTQAMLADRRRAFAISRSLMDQQPRANMESAFLEFALSLGDALADAARDAGPADAARLWREARDTYTQGHARALSLEARKALSGRSVEHAARLRAGIDRCERALPAGGRS